MYLFIWRDTPLSLLCCAVLEVQVSGQELFLPSGWRCGQCRRHVKGWAPLPAESMLDAASGTRHVTFCLTPYSSIILALAAGKFVAVWDCGKWCTPRSIVCSSLLSLRKWQVTAKYASMLRDIHIPTAVAFRTQALVYFSATIAFKAWGNKKMYRIKV